MSHQDHLARRSTALVVWGPPVAALIVSSFLPTWWHVVIWPAALTWMGVGCVANAGRCGRTHCYFTGPFFLLLAAVSLSHGLAIVPLGPDGWSRLGVVLGVGGVGLWVVPELIWGRYLRQTSQGGSS